MKKIWAIFMCGIMALTITGCGKKIKKTQLEDLQKINNEIIKYFSDKDVKNYENFIFNYIDEENKVVVVGLLDNSEKEQEKFKNTVVNSDLIKFVKGEKLVDYESDDKQPSINQTPFIRTYHVLNVAESNAYSYLYITIRQFQGEEVQTVKIERSLCPDITSGKNYEFKLKPNGQFQENILSIFNNSTLLEIKETDKIGADQIQEIAPIK